MNHELSIRLGAFVEIRPAYRMDDEPEWDSIAGCAGWITAVHEASNEVDVQIRNGDEVDHVAVSRIRLR